MDQAIYVGPNEPPMPPMPPIPPAESPDMRTYAVIGAAQEVHSALGPGFLENVYHLALARELRRREVPFEVEVELPVVYKGEPLPCTYRVDLLCYGEVIVELKAQRTTTAVEEAQVLNYLKASALEVGLLLNFGTTRLEVRRFARSWHLDESAPSAPSAVS